MIRSDDCNQGYDGTDRSGGQIVEFPERDALNALVDAFAVEMKAKLFQKYREGWGGWDEPVNREVIEQKLRSHVERGSGQYVDVANLAAMLWNIEH